MCWFWCACKCLLPVLLPCRLLRSAGVYAPHACHKPRLLCTCFPALCLQEYSAVYVGSQGLEQLLELMANDGDTRPLVVTSRDRLDIVMGLLASQVCVCVFVSMATAYVNPA